MSDINKPSTWVEFKPSLCKDCQGSCCKLPVDVHVSDLVRLGLITQEESLGSGRDIASKLMNMKVIQSFRASTMDFTLTQRDNQDCIFLDEVTRLCTVYENRPDVCRRFPAEVGPRIGWCPEKKKQKA